ncbi:MAG: hypothetical protein AAFS01_10965 [Pseudomonadota bacterium]
MFRTLLPAALCLVARHVHAQDEIEVPGLTAPGPVLELPACENTQDDNNCARFLACIGREGLWVDGQARGWNAGTLAAQRSDGAVCQGRWTYRDGLGIADTRFECSDGSTGWAVYVSQDSSTGTGIADGIDSRGRRITAWTGASVIEFLTREGGGVAELPCTDATIPIS